MGRERTRQRDCSGVRCGQEDRSPSQKRHLLAMCGLKGKSLLPVARTQEQAAQEEDTEDTCSLPPSLTKGSAAILPRPGLGPPRSHQPSHYGQARHSLLHLYPASQHPGPASCHPLPQPTTLPLLSKLVPALTGSLRPRHLLKCASYFSEVDMVQLLKCLP